MWSDVFCRRWPAEGAVGVHLARITGQHGGEFGGVMDVGRGDLDAADQPGAFVGGEVRLVAAGGLAAAVPGPARLGVAADAGGRDQCRVHQRAGAHRNALGLELAGYCLEQHAVKAVADQFAPEADEGGAPGRRLVGGEAAEPAEAGTVVQRLCQPLVGEVVPRRRQQGLEQRQRLPAGLPLRGGRDARQVRIDLPPVEQGGEFRQRRCRARLKPRSEVLPSDPSPCHRPLPLKTAGNQGTSRRLKHIRARVS